LIDNAAALFNLGNLNGVTYDTANSFLRLGNAGGCNGSTTNCSELDSSWTPEWPNLVGYWSFDGTLGAITDGTTLPSVMGATTATVFNSFGGVAYTAGKLSTGINFDGNSGDYVRIPRIIQDDFTIAFWMKTPSGASQPGCGIFYQGQGLVNAEVGGVTGDFGTSFCGTGVSFGTGSPDVSVMSSASVNDGNWHSVVGTRVKSTGSLRLYIDGALAGTGTGGTQSLTAPSYITFGVIQTLIGYFNGQMDDIAMWSVALTPAEVAIIYSRQAAKYAGVFTSRVIDGSSVQNWKSLVWAPTLPFSKPLPDFSNGLLQSENSGDYPFQSASLMSGLLGLWHFDELAATTGASNDFKDSSGNGNFGEATGGVVFGAPGRFGNAMTLNGSTGFVNLKNTIQLDAGNFTIAGWFQTSSATTQQIWNSGYNGSNPDLEVAMIGGKLEFYARDASYTNSNLQATFVSNDGFWHHFAAVRAGNVFTLYIDGKSNVTNVAAVGDVDVAGVVPAIGNGLSAINNRFFNGSLDEIAVWNRALGDGTAGSANEILELYRRGANRVKYQVRSCTDSTCSANPSWQGPDNTNQTYFSEWNNNAVPADGSDANIGDSVLSGPPALLFSNFSSLAVTSARFFQYRMILESDDSGQNCNYGSGGGSAICSPEILTVKIGH
jgi:hypothetical protein